MVKSLVNKENFIPLLSLCISIIIGLSVTYSTINKTDATLSLRIEYLEQHWKQAQKERNILQVRLSTISTQIHESLRVLESLSQVVRENTDSNNRIAVLIARLEERQIKADKIVEGLVNQINSRKN
jgi:hypothetical protein